MTSATFGIGEGIVKIRWFAMRQLNGVVVEHADTMSDLERLETAFFLITNQAVSNLENELEIAKAMSDAEAKKLYHIQIGMFKHAQSIFDTAKKWALNDGQADDAKRDALLQKLQRPNTKIRRDA